MDELSNPRLPGPGRSRIRRAATRLAARCVGLALVIALGLSAAPAVAQDPPPEATDEKPAEGAAPTDEAAGEPTTAPDAAPKAESRGWRLADLVGVPAEGFLAVRYRGRRTHHDDDHDADAVLSLDLGDRLTSKVTAHVLMRLDWDLDGDQGETGFSTFDSLADTNANPVLRVFDAYLEAHHVWPWLESVRLGRQHLFDTPVLAAVDGVRFETEACPWARLRLGAYAGQAVRLYTSAPESEPLAGAFAEVQPVPAVRLRAEWMHAPDADNVADQRDDLLGFTGWWTIGEWVRLHARHTRLEGHARDLRADAALAVADHGFRLQAGYGESFRTQRTTPVEFDLFVSTLVVRTPYREARVLASQEVGPHLMLEAGADRRWLTDDDDEGPYNREFMRARTRVTVLERPEAGFSASGEWDVWESQGRRFWTLAGEIGWRSAGGLDLRAGTDYALYVYDALDGRERDHVRTWYGRVRWDVARWLRLSADYAWEDDEFEIVQTVKVGATWRF